MAVRYLQVETLKAWQRSDLQLEDDLYEAAIEAAEQSIDHALGRRVAVASGTPSARNLRPRVGTMALWIPDAVSVTSVVENGVTLVEDTDYDLEPVDAVTMSGESVPYHGLGRRSKCWYTKGRQATVVVTADWGWSAIPPLIVEAAKIVAKDILEQRDIRFGLVDISESGGVGTRENRVVRQVMAEYTAPSKMAAMVY